MSSVNRATWLAAGRLAGTLALTATLAAACASSSGGNSGSSSSSAPAGGGGPSSSSSSGSGPVATVETHSGAMGTFLTDAAGRSLYLFDADKGRTSACSGNCATYWPPLLTGGAPKASGSAVTAKLGTTTRSDGTKQVTYNGHPLYTYAADTAAGVTSGQGSDNFGAKWWLVAPSGQAITSSSAGSSSASSSSAGGGGGGWS